MKPERIAPSTEQAIKLYRDLDAVGADAGGQLDRACQRSMYDRLDWFRLVAKHTLDGEVQVLHAQVGADRAWLFLDRQEASAHSLNNWYGLCFAPVTQGEPGNAVFDGLADGLLDAGITHLFIDPLAEEGPLGAALRRKGWLVSCEQVNECWWIDTKGKSFEHYWDERPSRLRNTAARKAKKADLEIRILTEYDDETWSDLEAVFEASWKKPEGSPELIRDIARAEGEAGALRVGIAYKDGLPVAAQFWTVENGSATIHKLAYREDHKKMSAGTILSVEMFRHVLNIDKVDEIDFGIGNDSYKREWMTDCRPLYALTAYYPYRASGIIGIARVALRKVLLRLGLRKAKVSLRDQPRR